MLADFLTFGFWKSLHAIFFFIGYNYYMQRVSFWDSQVLSWEAGKQS